jgi:hypothetical protein
MLGIDLAGGAIIFLAFLLLYTLAVAYGLYARRGSGIDEHPYGNAYDAATGARNRRPGRDGFAAMTRGTR